MAFLRRPVTKITLSIPEAMHSSTAYWISGLSTTGNISLGCAFVAGRNRVPKPATGRTALRTRFRSELIFTILSRSYIKREEGRENNFQYFLRLIHRQMNLLRPRMLTYR